MESQEIIVGEYKSHSDAADAVRALQDSGIAIHDKVSIVGKGELIEDHLEIEVATTALWHYILFGFIVGTLAGVAIVFYSSDKYTLELFLTAFSIGGLMGAAIGVFRAYVIGPKGELHLHKHLKMNNYKVILHDYTAEDEAKARKLMGS